MLSSSSSSTCGLVAPLDHVVLVLAVGGGLVGDLFLFLDRGARGLLADLGFVAVRRSSLAAICSAVGPLRSIASRSRISRNCMRPSLSALDQPMIASKVIGLSHRPQIMMSRPASMRLAMAISPSRESNSTAPISRRYMRTGSSVRSVGSFLVAAAGRGPPSSSGIDLVLGRGLVLLVLVVVGFLILDDVDAHVVERGHDVLDLLGRHLVLGKASLISSIGDDAALLGARDHLLDRRVVEVEQRGIAGLAGIDFLWLRSLPWYLESD